jgi:NAD(P)-dependent dehydrogenase (short-subunit alcohol dehydrogenase family)
MATAGNLQEVDTTDMAKFDAVIAVNLRGTFLGMKHAARSEVCSIISSPMSSSLPCVSPAQDIL